LLIIQVIIPHNKKTPKKPAIKEGKALLPAANATKNEAKIKLHHGKNNPNAKVSIDVSIKLMTNFMI